jgi:hypothetical protein
VLWCMRVYLSEVFFSTSYTRGGMLIGVSRSLVAVFLDWYAILQNGQALELFLEESPRLAADRACASLNRPSSLHVSTNRMRKVKETSKA